MEIFATSGLINAIVALSFGALVALKNWRERINQLFILMIFSFTVWAFSYWQWLSADGAEDALLWIRMVAVGSLFIPLFFFHWAVLLTNTYARNRYVVGMAYLLSLGILFFYNSPLFVQDVEQKLFFEFWPNPGILYVLYFFALYLGLILYALAILYLAYRKETDTSKRGQILYVIWGAVLGFGGGLTNFFLWYDIMIPPYGNFMVVAFPFLLGYSVIKHRLFHAKAIATEILVFFIVTILLVQTILAASTLELVLRGLFLIVVSGFGYLLIRSVYHEVESREKIERLARDLEKANARLRELDQMKSEFVSLASHQLRSPLTAIKGYASMVLEGSFGSIGFRTREAVTRIFESSVHLAAIVEDFLNVTKIEQGGMKFEFTSVDMVPLVKQIAGELMPNVDRRGLTLTVTEPSDGKPYVATADREKIRQVIANLIDNAIKYTEQGGIVVSFGRDDARHRVVVLIHDTGVGLTEEQIGKLFKKFSRSEAGSKMNTGGSGLGLYLGKEIARAHRGELWAESDGPGKGTTFHLELLAEQPETL